MWGTYGKGGAEHCAGTCPEHRLVWKKLVDCDTEHLQSILRTQRQIVDHYYTDLIHAILADRGVKPVRFSLKACNMFLKKVASAKRWSHEPETN